MGGRPSWRGLVVLTIAGAALALGMPATGQEPQRGGALRVGLQGDFTTLDPHMSTSAEDRDLYYQLYTPLVGLDANLRIVPELAESWEQPDSLTYIFRLRRGVKFHDGTDLTAEVVKWNVERMLDPATGSIRRSELGNVKSVDVTDLHTIRLNLKQPDAALLATLADRAGMMVSRAAVEKYGKDFVAILSGPGRSSSSNGSRTTTSPFGGSPGTGRRGCPISTRSSTSQFLTIRSS